MKKMIMALALFASTLAVASIDVYTFKTTINYPEIGKTAFVRAKSALNGTLTVTTDEDTTNATAVLEVTLKKTGETYTLVADKYAAYAVFGKKNTDVATKLVFTNEDTGSGIIELEAFVQGTLKQKTTGGCTPCGDTTETCARVKELKGVVGGKFICPCGGTFTKWDGSCEIGEDEVEYMTIYGSSALFKLKTVDGKKW